MAAPLAPKALFPNAPSNFADALQKPQTPRSAPLPNPPFNSVPFMAASGATGLPLLVEENKSGASRVDVTVAHVRGRRADDNRPRSTVRYGEVGTLDAQRLAILRNKPDLATFYGFCKLVAGSHGMNASPGQIYVFPSVSDQDNVNLSYWNGALPNTDRMTLTDDHRCCLDYFKDFASSVMYAALSHALSWVRREAAARRLRIEPFRFMQLIRQPDTATSLATMVFVHMALTQSIGGLKWTRDRNPNTLNRLGLEALQNLLSAAVATPV